MKQYLELLNKVLLEGEHRDDRTGVGTRAIFGYQMRFNLKEGFPLITTKKLHTKSIIHELLWFLKGKTNNDYLKDRGVSIWNEWADQNGNLGPIYGHGWRNYGGKPESVPQKKSAAELREAIEKEMKGKVQRQLNRIEEEKRNAS